MTPTDFQLRIALSATRAADAANNYARSGIIRISDLFEVEVAEGLHYHLDKQVDWSRTSNRSTNAWDLTPDAIEAMDGSTEAELNDAIHKAARDGFQFLFDSLIVSDVAAERKARSLLVDRLIEALNHPASLDTFREITGAPDIRVVDGQATRYMPGHFLTNHDDGVDGQGRIAAYVINFTKGWRTDWGGMLQFHNVGGDIPLSLKPGFNTIHLFRVPQVHSVSYVAPLAALPRYAITGWLRR